MEEQSTPVNNTVFPPENSPPKAKEPKKIRAALCLNCNNEWMATNGNKKKPSRCPECGSRVVIWRDEADKMEKTEEVENGGNAMATPVATPENGMVKPENGMATPLLPGGNASFTTGNGMEKPVEKVETPVVKPVEKTEIPPVKMAMEKSENLDDITHDFQQTGFNIHPMLIVMVFGIIIFIGILFFRNSRKGKELVEKVVKPKTVQTAPPRRPTPAAIKPQSNFTRNSALVGGII